MKFAYYITNLYDGEVQGTNDAKLAADVAECEDFFVVHADSGEWLNQGGLRHQVEEYGSKADA